MELSFFSSYKNSKIHFRQWGQGEKILVCLHGFGEEADSFRSLALQLQNRYTVLAIDLPLHGQTEWNEGLYCSAKDLVNILDEVPDLHRRSFSLVGFSMGGRVALSVYEQIPERIEQLILLAPDGLKVNFWYWLATQTKAGNSFFLYLMKKPESFFAVFNMLKTVRMANLGIYHYVLQYLKDEAMRLRLYNIWTTMRKIKPHTGNIQRLIRKEKTPVLLVYGKYDRIIRSRTGLKFQKAAGDTCTLHLLSCGHRLLKEKNITEIASLL